MIPENSVLLDTARRTGTDEPGAVLFTDLVGELAADDYHEVGSLLDALELEASRGRWCAGFLTYEAAYALEGLRIEPPHPRPHPLAWFGIFDAPVRLTPDDVGQLMQEGSHLLRDVEFGFDRAAYTARVDRIRELILDGDAYQINLTAPLHFSLEGDPLDLYAALRRKQRVAYGGIIRLPDRWILSLSPELFVRRDGDLLTTRPMKGTAARGASNSEDRRQAASLAASAKDRAENVMIVDLLRNDLSRVAETGSVQVPSLFEVERYDTLWQMTSTVTARARAGVGVAEILAALFPCGSVTGAPKRRAMERIRELEPHPRGVYCGAIGVVKPGGDFVFNVPIRTLEIENGRGRMGVGSGIVWDSDPGAELEECRLKARFLTEPPTPPFALLETMRAEAGLIPLLELHLQRLEASAEYFDRPFEIDRVLRSLGDVGPGCLKVRLMLHENGDVSVESETLDPDEHYRRAIVFPERVSSADPFLRHKTTHRPLYDRALAWARTRGADEAILLNDQGRVVEGTLSNVWIRRGSQLVTPPEEEGGLAGVYRAHLLSDRPDTAEGPITLDELLSADEVFLSNAVRGLRRVEVFGS